MTLTLNDTTPHFPAFSIIKSNPRRLLQSDVKTANTYITTYQPLTAYFQYSTGKNLLSASDFCIFAPAIERTVFLCQKPVIYEDRGWS
jgi:hypothetical protein